MPGQEPNSERELVALAWALGAGSVQGVSTDERKLPMTAGAPSRRALSRVRAEIKEGADPRS